MKGVWKTRGGIWSVLNKIHTIWTVYADKFQNWWIFTHPPSPKNHMVQGTARWSCFHLCILCRRLWWITKLLILRNEIRTKTDGFSHAYRTQRSVCLPPLKSLRFWSWNNHQRFHSCTSRVGACFHQSRIYHILNSRYSHGCLSNIGCQYYLNRKYEDI